MAFTSADLTAIDSAIVTLATDGIATVTVNGETVTATDPEKLFRLRQQIAQLLAASTADTTFGIRMVKTKPPGAG